ncbi:putative reverse transcriptase domain-containing protein [Tanacetum coccineum]
MTPHHYASYLRLYLQGVLELPTTQLHRDRRSGWVGKRAVRTDTVYAMTWKELMRLVTEMVLEEEHKIERLIWGLPNSIQGNVTSFSPTRLQDDIRMVNSLMDQKLHANTARQANNKRKWEDHSSDNRCKLHRAGPCTMKCGNYKKIDHMTRDYKTPDATTNQRAPVANKKTTVTCFECGRQGHYHSDCQKLKNQNRGNQDGNNEAGGRAFTLGGGEANQDSIVVMGTFLLNNRYASMLFDSGADRSFVSTTVSSLIDVVLVALDVSYTVELADGRVVRSDTIEGGCHVFLAQITEKKTEDKSKEKRLEDVPIMRDFMDVFSEDLPGLPLARKVKF